MPRGRGGGGRTKRTHKGGYRSFSSEDELRSQAEQMRKDRELRGENIDEEEEPKAEGATAEAATAEGEANSSDEESSDEDSQLRKGVASLIEIENPNRVKGASKLKKVSEITTEGDAQLSRKEREELERQRAKAAYLKAHLAGQTDEARADLARLAIIRQQREEAARKRDGDKKGLPSKEAASSGPSA